MGVGVMISAPNFHASPCFPFKLDSHRFQAKVRPSDAGDLGVLPLVSPTVNGTGTVRDYTKIELPSKPRAQLQGLNVEDKAVVSKNMEVLWDDGYGTKSVKNYLDDAREIIKPDGGPPRWFCPVECGWPPEGSPVLLFLPGMDGVGLGLLLHHKALSKAFEFRCMHIPVYDRTPFEGLVKFVEETVRAEHVSSPNKPIYLVGDSMGACLALTVAARNPDTDLVLILINPATSFDRSQLQPLLPFLEALPDELHSTVPYLLSSVMADPLKMAMANIPSGFPLTLPLEQLSENLVALLMRLSVLSDIIPKETLLWKLRLLKSAAAYANSRLHAVKADVLVLASGRDNMVPSSDEAERLSRSLHNCTVRNYKDNGHALLLEDGQSLLTIIKATCKYRHSRTHDFVNDFLPPSMSEFKKEVQRMGLFWFATSPVLLSTLQDGTIVRGLGGIPDAGPVLYVGYHMLLGLELAPIVKTFLEEKNIMVRGLAHPQLFQRENEISTREFSYIDVLKLFGATPVTPGNLFRLLSTKSHILLYPGGAAEALHPKGEEYKLSWPDQPQFVRMAARFGATIIPFGVVGEDDLAEVVVDYNDMMKIPMVSDYYRKRNSELVRLREGEEFYIPGLLPKMPGRFYYLFGRPVETKGKENMLSEKHHARELYLQIKSEVENCIDYLRNKRRGDPYRGIIERAVYGVAHAIDHHRTPAFDP